MDALPRPQLVSQVGPPGGHYSTAILHDGLIYISGQLGVRPDGSHTTDLPFEAQARQALTNVLAIASEVGASPWHLLKVTAYIVGVANWPAFNAVYAELMGDARPARTVVPVPELHYGYLVEIDAVAVAPAGAGES
jgi:2-iminobutanoate/2-iminopropanoate deaminase